MQITLIRWLHRVTLMVVSPRARRRPGLPYWRQNAEKLGTAPLSSQPWFTGNTAGVSGRWERTQQCRHCGFLAPQTFTAPSSPMQNRALPSCLCQEGRACSGSHFLLFADGKWGSKDGIWDTPGREGIPQFLLPMLDLALFQLPLLLLFAGRAWKGFGWTWVQVCPLSLLAVWLGGKHWAPASLSFLRDETESQQHLQEEWDSIWRTLPMLNTHSSQSQGFWYMQLWGVVLCGVRCLAPCLVSTNLMSEMPPLQLEQ